LILLAEGAAHQGMAVLDALRRDAAAEGRSALVELIASDVDERVVGSVPEPPIVIEVLAPELRVSVAGEAVPIPRGFPAKLLALLVATKGVMTIDEAIERLWPGADPAIGRNRLHAVLLRLRRGLGMRADGPISCTEGLVRMDVSPQLGVDSWEFERLATDATTRVEAATRYRADVLSTQFAYDDTVAVYRRALRRTFLRLAIELLDDPTCGMGDDDLASLARLACQLVPDDENVSRAGARTLARLGLHAEAREVLAVSAAALDELGLDGAAFRRRELAQLHATVGVGR
jgi:DNA-binding SARP family transcriptional activator